MAGTGWCKLQVSGNLAFNLAGPSASVVRLKTYTAAGRGPAVGFDPTVQGNRVMASCTASIRGFVLENFVADTNGFLSPVPKRAGF